jgi:uncharacterized protein (TIGR03067 family)
MRISSVAKVLCALLSMLSVHPNSATAHELDGEWRPVTGERDGTPADSEEIGRTRFIFKDGTFTVSDGVHQDISHFTTSKGEAFSSIDVMPNSGNFKGKIILGTYHIDDKRLSMCLNTEYGLLVHRPKDAHKSETGVECFTAEKM